MLRRDRVTTISDDSNEALFTRFRAEADREAFDVLVRRTAPRLALAAARAGVAAEDVDDVVQETYLAAFVAAARFDATRNLADWLHGILAKKAVDLCRQRTRRRIRPERMEQPVVEPPDARTEAREALSALDEALGQIPDHYGEVLRLYYQRRVPVAEIAEHVGCTQSTVRTRISRGVAWLRKKLPPGLTPALLGALALQGRAAAMATSGDAPDDPSTAAASVSNVVKMAVGVTLAIAVVLLITARDDAPASSVATTATTETADSERASAAPGTARQQMAARVPLEDPAPAAPAAPPTSERESSVRVLVQREGKPVADVAVGLEPVRAEMPTTVWETQAAFRSATTGANGIATFPAFEPGRIRLRLGQWDTRLCEIGTDRLVVVEVDRVATIRGVVVDAQGQPVARAEVRRDITMGAGSPGTVAARTEPDGSFQLAVADANRVSLWARVPGEACSARRSTRFDKGSSDVTLVLHPAPGRVSGHVWDAHGQPARNARVMVRRRDPVFDVLPSAEKRRRGTLPPVYEWTDANGGLRAADDHTRYQHHRGAGGRRLVCRDLPRHRAHAGAGLPEHDPRSSHPRPGDRHRRASRCAASWWRRSRPRESSGWASSWSGWRGHRTTAASTSPPCRARPP